jgi:predicted GIY-YIG superfamily endonuclease
MYNITKLVWLEPQATIRADLPRKRSQSLARAKKVSLIESLNPRWDDLYNAL